MLILFKWVWWWALGVVCQSRPVEHRLVFRESETRTGEPRKYTLGGLTTILSSQIPSVTGLRSKFGNRSRILRGGGTGTASSLEFFRWFDIYRWRLGPGLFLIKEVGC